MLPIRREAFSWILVLLSLAATIETSQTSEGRVVCYYTNWSIYRPGTAKFSPQNINPYLCTHLIYAFGGFTKDNKLKPFDKYQDIEKGGYAKFTGLKSYNKNLKVLLAIGGWNEGSSRFSSMVASADRRREFVKNTVKFLRQNHFDGLDLDWEYPAFRDGGKPRDKNNYAQFVQELREEFERESEKTGRPRLLLTMAVPAGIEYIQKGYDIPKLNKNLDWFNLLTYDYHSAFEPSVNHHAPLFPLEKASEYNYDSELNIDYSIKFYINEGADPSKLVLGIPTYGRTYTLLNEESTDIGAPTDGPGAQGDATREKGYLAYYEICQGIKDDDSWTVVQPNPNAMGPYAFRENQWVGYDDEAIARKKGEYVVANGLGGIMFWSIDNDDFRGTCHGRPYPIIEAAKEAMLNKIGGNENEVLTPARRKKPSRSRSRTNASSKTNNVNDQDEEKTTQRRPSSSRRKPTSSPATKEAVQYSSARTTTPPPPTTPDPGSDFKCEEEGFFQHPRDCKKYFWCLDSGPSNLGIVAHQFTCPSGLVFNKLTDSCDYTRNVQCDKPKATTQSATTESTTKVSSTVKSIIIGRPSTTTTAQPEEEEEEEEEYDEDEEEEAPEEDTKTVNTKIEHALEEEDPEVIKELISLIKKVGGLDELEKQLQMRLNQNSVAYSRIGGTDKTTTTTTTVSPISQSLYNKVLGTKRGSLRTQKIISSGTSSNTESEIAPLVQRQNKENRYSSVIRNSRPRPQNDGLDQLPEVEGGGIFRERPQYTTITRTQAPKTHDSEEESESGNATPANVENVNEDDNKGPTTHQPVFSYVNIQRARPSSTAAPVEDRGNESDDEAEEEEDEQPASVQPTTTTKMQYVNIQRIRPTKQQYISDEIESETPAPETKYQTVSRKRPTTTQVSIIDQDDDRLDGQRVSSSTTTETATIKPSRKYAKPTMATPTTVKPTTYHHVFAIDYDENPLEKHFKNSQKPNEIGQDDPNAEVISKKVEKLAEVSRIVEVYSQQRRQTIQRSSPNGRPKTENSNLIIERLPTVNKLGEINRVTLIKLVDHQNDTNAKAKEFLTFLTTTARPATDDDNVSPKKVQEKKSRQIILPDNIFSVETSTIPLEGLFQTDRSGKKLNIVYATTSDDSYLRSSPSPVFIPQSTTESSSVAQTTVVDYFGDTTADAVNDIHVVKAEQPNTLQINDSAPPLVISLANLDNVVLSQLPPKNSTTTTTTTTKHTKANAFDGAVASSGKVRPQYRPGFRRPSISVQKKSKPTQSNDITDTTESSASVTTRKSSNSPYVRRRSRPTYIPTTSHTTVAAIASTVANRNNDTIVNKILQRRKFGRPSSSSATAVVATTNNASERKRVSPTKTRPTTESAVAVENTRRTPNPLFRRRFGYTSTTKLPKTTTIEPETLSISSIGSARHSSDQDHEPSIVDNRKFSQSNQIDLGTEIISQGLGEAITSISRAPLPFVVSTTVRNVKITTPGAVKYDDDTEYQISKRADSLSSGSIKPSQHFSSTVGPELLLPHSEIQDSQARPSRDFKRTQKVIRTFSQSNLNSDPNAKVTATLKEKPKKIAFRPAGDYDYYDDDDSIIGRSTSKVKVILHDAGIIECLDQGNFPHPLSCRKFISCAKMEIGGVVGWEYTCPKGLSYDPVGGICNWSAGLGCKE